METSSLNRFLEAQEYTYETALNEIRNGEKETCWMWYIFPQLRGLGSSEMSYTYGLDGIEEAKAYLNHPVLSARLVEITAALLQHQDIPIEDLIGDLDVEKLRSCMTLFALLSDNRSVFHEVLDCFYDGELDKKTITMISKT